LAIFRHVSRCNLLLAIGKLVAGNPGTIAISILTVTPLVVVAAGYCQCFGRCCGRCLLLVTSTLRPRGHTLVAFSWHRCVRQCVVVPPLSPRCTCCAPRRILASRTMHGACSNKSHPGEHTARSEPFHLIPFELGRVADDKPLRERTVLLTPPSLLERSCPCKDPIGHFSPSTHAYAHESTPRLTPFPP